MKHSYVACDLGAGSGRVMLGHLEAGKLELEEVHRFVSEPVRIFDSLRWNVLEIFRELKAGLRKVAERGIQVESVSVDSWGVDYVLFRDGTPQLAPPFHYRDARTDAPYATAFDKVDRETVFENTGIQFMSINTLYQLLSDVEKNGPVLQAAEGFLNIGDYFNYLLSGVPRAEESLASTTQLYDPRTRQWSQEIIRRFELPAQLFPEIVPPGTRLGKLRPEIENETGLQNAEVIATCSHDTGAAVSAVPSAAEDTWAYLSSGTWSLVGVELRAPLLHAQARECNFTNEAGFGGTTRFLKNIVGLWILQECRREWTEAGDAYTYPDLLRMGGDATPLRSLINPNAQRFWKPGDMIVKIQTFCEETRQPIPETPGDILRCVLESLALLYRRSIEEICSVTAREIRTLHIVGGGSKNTLLNQFAANATGREVVAGPVEATAIGNVLIQAIACGHLASLPALREVVRKSFSVEHFHPAAAESWAAAYARFREITSIN